MGRLRALMTVTDPLAEFYVATPRQAAGLTGRTGVHGQVDGILNELRVPAEVDKDGDWKLTTDVGPFLLIVDKEKYDLVAIQTIQPMEKVKKAADEMYVLLALNFEARGLARFGTVKDAGQDLLVLTARLAPETIARESVEGLLTDCFRLSRRVDELLGNAPPQAAAQPGGWQAADAAIAQAEGAPAAAQPPPQAPPAGPEQPAEPVAADLPPPAQPPIEAPAAETVFAAPVPQAPAASSPAEPAAPEPAPAAEPAAPAEQQGDQGLNFPPPQVDDPTLRLPPPAQQPAAQPSASYPPPAQPTPPPQQLAPANWYPDPYNQARLRYWDGQSWTEHVAN